MKPNVLPAFLAPDEVRRVLLLEGTVTGMVTKIFPLVTDSAKMPYIAYRIVGVSYNVTKSTSKALGPSTTRMEMAVVASTYEEARLIASAVAEVLEGVDGMQRGGRYPLEPVSGQMVEITRVTIGDVRFGATDDAVEASLELFVTVSPTDAYHGELTGSVCDAANTVRERTHKLLSGGSE